MADQPAGGASTPRSQGEASHGGPWRRAGVVVLSVLGIVALSVAAVAGLLWWRGEAALDRLAVGGLSGRLDSAVSRMSGRDGPAAGEDGDLADEPSEAASEPGIETVDEPFVVLVTGVDGDLSGLTPEQRRRVAIGGEREGQRPDTIILLRVDPGADQVAMLSLPRDLLVRRCDGSLGKVNGAWNVGDELPGSSGPTCLVTTVTRHTGIGVQYYVEVSFAGFMEVVDAVGGVRMQIPTSLQDAKSKLDLEPGCQVLDGPAALAYVRARGFDNDFGRMARQQAFARELLEEITRAGILANPVRLLRLVDALAGAVDVSDNLGYGDMRAIAASLTNLDEERLATATVSGRIVARPDLGGASVVEEDRAVTVPLYQAFRSGRLTEGLPTGESDVTDEPTAPSEPALEIVDARDVPPVRVLNAQGTPGLAARTAQLLESRGLRVGEVGDAPIRHSRSVVQHGPGLEREARTVAQALGGLAVRERVDLPGPTADEPGAVVAVIGSDLVDAQVPDLRGSSAGAPTPTQPATGPSPLPEQTSPDYVGVPSATSDC